MIPPATATGALFDEAAPVKRAGAEVEAEAKGALVAVEPARLDVAGAATTLLIAEVAREVEPGVQGP